MLAINHRYASPGIIYPTTRHKESAKELTLEAVEKPYSYSLDRNVNYKPLPLVASANVDLTTAVADQAKNRN